MKKVIRTILFFVILLLLTYLYAHADVNNEIAVTEVEISESNASIIANNSLKINDILLVKDTSGENNFQMPSYMDTDKKEIPYVTLLTDDAKSAVQNALYNNAIDMDSDKSVSFKITQITPYDEEDTSLKARATLVLNEAVAIEVRIVETDEKLWVMWPMKKDGNSQKWVKLVEVTENSMKKMTEKIVLKKYMQLNK